MEEKDVKLPVVVPRPSPPRKKEDDVDVEISEPTVNCDVVEMMFVPSELAVKIALLANASVAVKVPDIVTGEFVTVKAEGRDNPTDVTVPEPPPLPLIQVPEIEKHPAVIS